MIIDRGLENGTQDRSMATATSKRGGKRRLRRARTGGRPSVQAGAVQQAWQGLQTLEPRLLMNGAAPVFDTPLRDHIVPNDGTALLVGIDGFDADGDDLTITAQSNDPNLTLTVSEGNRFARMNIFESDGETPFGEMIFELLEDRLLNDDDVNPNAERFITLATTGFDEEGEIDPLADPFWSNMPIHRISPDFVIQTGDAASGDGFGDSPLGNFDAVADPTVASFADQGVLGFANSGSNLSNSDGQIFVTQRNADFLNDNFGIAGQLIKGFDVLEALNELELNGETPVNPPIIGSIDIFNSNQDATLTLNINDDFGDRAEVTVMLDDGNGNVVEQTIDVVDAGDRPSISFIGRQTFEPGSTNEFSVSITDDLNAPLDVTIDTDQPGVVTNIVPDGEIDNQFNITITVPNEPLLFDVTVTAVEAGFDDVDILEPTESMFTVSTVGNPPTIATSFPIPVNMDIGETDDVTVTITDDLDAELDVTVEADDPGVDVSVELTNPDADLFTITIDLPAAQQVVTDVTLSVNEAGLMGNLPHATRTFQITTAGTRPVIADPGQILVDRGGTREFDIEITDDLDAPLDVAITTEEEGVDIAVAPNPGDPTMFTVTVTVPDAPITFDASATAVETGLGDNELVTPASRTFSISTIGDPPSITGVPDRIDMAQGQSNVFNVTITDDTDDELDIMIEADQEGVDVMIQPLDSLPGLFEVTVDLPPDVDVNSDVTITINEPGVEGDPRTTETFLVTTVGERPTIGDPGEQRVDVGGQVAFTADIDDDTGAPLDVQIETDEDGVVATIDTNTFEVTIDLPAGQQKHFEVTISAVEAGFENLDPTEQTFTVTTLGNRPTIDDLPPIIMNPGQPLMFMPTITDDGGQPLDVTVNSSAGSVTAQIDQDTHEVTLTPTNDNYQIFTITVTAVERDFDMLTATSQIFDVVMDRGLIETDDSGTTFGGFAVGGDTLFVANGAAGLQVFDVSDPAAPQLLGETDLADARDVVVVGDVAFIADTNNAFVSLDISDLGDITEMNRVVANGPAQKVLIDGNVAFVSEATGGVSAYDITDPNAIFRISSIRNLTGGEVISDGFWLEKSGDTLFVGDRADGGGIDVLDVSDPAAMRHINTFLKQAILGMDLVDNLLYVPNVNTDNFIVFDVRRPTRQVRVGELALANRPRRVSVVGHTAVVARSNGFVFVDVTDPTNMFTTDSRYQGPLGGDPVAVNGVIALPFAQTGQIALVDSGEFDKRITDDRTITVTDENDVEVRINLRGEGLITVQTGDVGGGHIEKLIVTGSTRRTTLTISTVGGQATIDEVTINGPMRRFSARTTNINQMLQFTGFVDVLAVNDLNVDVDDAQMQLNIGAPSNFRAKTNFSFGRAQNLTILNLGPFSRFDGESWVNTNDVDDVVAGSFVDRFTIDGAFEADVQMNGFFAPRRTVGRVLIGGPTTNSDWQINGDFGPGDFRDTVRDSSILVGNEIQRLRFVELIDSTIEVGVLRDLRAAQIQGSNITADEIRRMQTTGSRPLDLPGHFTADVEARVLGTALFAGDVIDSLFNLTETPAGGLAARAMTVFGSLIDSMVTSAGRLGTFTLGRMVNSSIFAGVDGELDTALPDEAADFVNDTEIRRVRIRGLNGEAFAMVNSNMAASLLRDVTLTGVQTANDGAVFGLAARDIRRLNQTDLAGGATPIGGDEPGNDSVVRLLV